MNFLSAWKFIHTSPAECGDDPDGEQKTKGVRIGQDVAARITIDESSHRLCGSRELATAVRNAA